MAITDAFHTPSGSIIISVILGLGLAAVFRRACNERGCIVIKAPPFTQVDGKTFKVDDAHCYKYTPYAVSCERG